MAEKKDGWDIFEIITKAVAAILIPVVIYLAGQSFNNAQRDTERDLELVKIATDILRAPTQGTSDSMMALRKWAIDIFANLAESQDFTLEEDVIRYLEQESIPTGSLISSVVSSPQRSFSSEIDGLVIRAYGLSGEGMEITLIAEFLLNAHEVLDSEDIPGGYIEWDSPSGTCGELIESITSYSRAISPTGEIDAIDSSLFQYVFDENYLIGESVCKLKLRPMIYYYP